MWTDGSLTIREFAMREPFPLATIHSAVLEFLIGRDDVAVFGAHAVNAFVSEPRMTADVDILSPRAEALAEQIRALLNSRFGMAVRIREIGDGTGYRVYQVRKPANRHLVDVRQVTKLPPITAKDGIQIVVPAELIAQKVCALVQRRGRPKSGTDWRDLALLLLQFPKLKREVGEVEVRLMALDASPAVMAAWRELVAQEILPEDEDGF